MIRKTLFLKAAFMLSVAALPVAIDAFLNPAFAEADQKADKKSVDNELNRVVAKFPDKSIITYGEVQALMTQLPEKVLNETTPTKLFTAMLQRLVDSKILIDAAKKAGYDKQEAVQKSINEGKDTLRQKRYIENEVGKLIDADGGKILKEKYDEIISVLKKADDIEIKLSHILYKTEEEAEKGLKGLNAGKKDIEGRFNAAVQASSIDQTTKTKNGDIGWVRKSDIKNDDIFTTAPGNVVNKVIKLFDQGYSIFFVKEKRPAQPPTFEETKADIRQAITPQFAIQVVERLRRESGLELIGLDGKPLELPKMPEMPKLGTDPKDMPKLPEPKDFSHVNEKALDNSMVVGKFKNGDKITLGEVRDSMPSLPEELKGAPFHQLFQPLLLRVADTKLLIEKAKEAKIDEGDEFAKKEEEMVKSVIQRAYLQDKVTPMITPEKLKEAYQELLVMYDKSDMEISLRHIMVKTEEEAKALIKELMKAGPAKFNDMVKEKSIDESTKDKNGELGYIQKKQLPAELADILFKAKKATMLPEPIKLGDHGYSIIRVEDKRVVQPPALEQVKDKLAQLVSQRESAKILLKLREEAKVEMFDIKGKPLPAIPADAPTAAAAG